MPIDAFGYASLHSDKIDDWADFERHKIYSVDSTSPLIRAFKDARNNYYAPQTNGTLKYFTALRVPQALENPKLMRLIKRGDFIVNSPDAVNVCRVCLL